MAVVIADASPLIALAKIEHLHLLRDLFVTVFVTKSVIDECVFSKTKDADLIRQAMESGFLLCVENPIFTHDLSKSLGLGEQSSIEYALQIDEKTLLIMDDALARKHALRHNLSIVGTAALLFTAQRRGLINDADVLIERLNSTGYRISPAVIALIKNSQVNNYQ